MIQRLKNWSNQNSGFVTLIGIFGAILLAALPSIAALGTSIWPAVESLEIPPKYPSAFQLVGLLILALVWFWYVTKQEKRINKLETMLESVVPPEILDPAIRQATLDQIRGTGQRFLIGPSTAGSITRELRSRFAEKDVIEQLHQLKAEGFINFEEPLASNTEIFKLRQPK